MTSFLKRVFLGSFLSSDVVSNWVAVWSDVSIACVGGLGLPSFYDTWSQGVILRRSHTCIIGVNSLGLENIWTMT